ncbi:Adenylate cyclase 1 [Rubripirellula obstinata]|uniref:Adenylate cyclase 1 n=1 Tax=Rubripirellula obstinata TaxID=406547 RepID=A0A5B1CPG1_9BACT|nr:adenylate/guanylate cyclase domain-containing protein [Rubripirellula obstinata]KAA1261749.1 Adenylate cyclase 1 [Rubripirellula obstinata]
MPNRRPKVDIKVCSSDQIQSFVAVPLPVELGRQNKDDNGWMALQNLGDRHRIAVAPRSETNLSREALRICTEHGNIIVANMQGRSIYRIGDETFPPNQSVTVTHPVQIHLLDHVSIEISPSTEDRSSIVGDIEQTIGTSAIPSVGLGAGKLRDLLQQDAGEGAGQVAVGMVRRALEVMRMSVGSDQFFQAAARNTAAMIELDRAVVLVMDPGGNLSVRAAIEMSSDSSEGLDTANRDPNFDTYPDADSSEVVEPFASMQTSDMDHSYSNQLVDTVLKTRKKAIYEPANMIHTIGSSLMTLDRAVAAPMLDDAGEVLGVLYGDRKFTGAPSEKPISELEATLLEVMAGAVASGLVRQREESVRAAMAQFFSPEVTERLSANENLLVGRDAEVTVMFCDIRSFSRITERVGPEKTIEWINDVLSELSKCVVATDGVLVDYVGDELMAMWGAPGDQPDHAVRACMSALEMIGKTEMLRQRWNEITPDGFGFGIGINTGVARVGNTGSTLKFKYGPLGNTVNLASRIQGMTKKFGVQVLVAQSTRDAVNAAPKSDSQTDPLSFRRLADVQPLGVNEVVSVHQLDGGKSDWVQRCRGYDEALAAYNRQDLGNAVQLAGSMIHQYPEDGPMVRLLGRIIDAMTSDTDFDPVIRFQSK